MANVSKLKYGDNTYDIKDASARHEAIDSTVSSDTSKLISSGAVKTYVDSSIAALPEPMIFKGTVGTGGTITSLPAAAASNEGFTYKVISNLSTPVIAKIGDTVISNGSAWTVIPSGDEPGGTVTNVATGTGLTGGPITSTGTISHADTSSQSSVSNSGRTYIQSVTLDGMGHVTGLTSATETVVNTDANVTQTATNTNANYEVLFSGTADNTTRTEGARKYSNLTFNPSTGNLNTTQINGVTVGSSPKFTDTDTKVTAVGNHYTPATDSSAAISASASGATAAWGVDVVKGVTLSRDAKGHVTDVSVTSGKIPANPIPSNNVTGSGTSGYIAKWNGANTVTNGPAIGSDTTKYLRNDGTWAVPPGTTDISGKVNKSGDTMSGTLTYTPNTVQQCFRLHDSYDVTESYQTAGNEALVFATKNPVTSFMFVNGEDSKTNIAQDRWQSLTPGLQVKNNKVAINKLIANNVNPTYELDVNGTINATDVKVNGTSLPTASHKHSFTPAGTVSSSFSGSAVTSGATGSGSRADASTPSHTHSVTAEGSVSSSFSGNEVSTGKPVGTSSTATYTTSVANGDHTHSYTPAGSVSSSFSGSAVTSGKPDTTNVASVASSGHTHTTTSTGTASADSTNKASVAKGDHTHSVTAAGSVSSTFTGTAVTSGAGDSTNKATVAKGDHTHTVTGSVSSTFTGSAVTSGANSGSGVTVLTGVTYNSTDKSLTFNSGTAGPNSHTHSVTAAGSVSSTFSSGSASATASGSQVSVSTASHTHSVTAAGTVSSTFTGSAVTSGATASGSRVDASTAGHTHSVSVSGTSGGPSGTTSVPDTNHTHSVTAAGSVGSSFSGTAATIAATGTSSRTAIPNADHIHKVTATGSVSSTFTGTAVTSGSADTTNKVSVAKGDHTHSVTASGSVSSTFSGSAGTTGTAS